MITRLGLSVLLVSTLAACSSVPDRYAPWRDNDEASSGRTPNLADVPAAPNVDAAKSEMESMRQRLERDRQNAYLVAQGIVPLDDEMSPVQPNSAPISSTDMPMPLDTAQPAVISGNVEYNYDDAPDYSYGRSAIQIDRSAFGSDAGPSDTIVSNDPSVSVDWSAMGGSSSSSTDTISRTGISTSSGAIAHFDHGSAKVSAKDRQAIKQLANDLKARPRSVMIAGNASKRTGLKTAAAREVNLRMSALRAEAVMQELVNLGVSPEQLFISAYGDAVPSNQGESGDRRVEIIFDR